ncbi:MAG TPA: hypothetical protein VK879_10555 [Candidatus Sulfomarinibacteraceae bacterium]|nr:hypothetical protein [Candidatus Sulfomarinibacteraceae bacterium]
MPTSVAQKTSRREAKAVGPAWVGQVLPIDVEADGRVYRVQWLPDRNNDLLREAGKPMHFYYLPDRPRLARDEDGHYIFHLQKFSGVMDPTKNIGEDGFAELTGGALTFTATLGMPKEVLDQAFEGLKKALPQQESVPHFFRSDQESGPAPVLGGPVRLHSNRTVLHQLSLEGQGPGGNGAGPQPWAFEIQGAGDGTLNVQGSNAYTVMLGNRPAQMLLASAESGSSQVTLENHIGYEIWTLVTEIKIKGEWESIYKHYSHHMKGNLWFTHADFKRETNRLIQNDTISVEVSFGAGMVDASQQQAYEQAADAIAQTMMERIKNKMGMAQQQANEEAAEVTETQKRTVVKKLGWFTIWRSSDMGMAFKSRKDEFRGELDYTKTINKQVVRQDVLSSQMEGLFDETSRDEEARQRYFSDVYFEEGFKKIHVVASANANWGNGEERGDPIHRVKLQVGYPDSKGNLIWKTNARFKDNDAEAAFSEEPALVSWTPQTKDRLYVFDFTRHDGLGETADKIHLRKIVSFKEAPNVAANEVTLEERTNTHVVEVRAESAGRLKVGPISLDMPLGSDQVQVLVNVRTPTFGEKVLTFDAENEHKPQFYTVWYAGPDKIEPYEYKAEVVVTGKKFGQRALRWEGDWIEGEGSGPLVVEVPPVPEDVEEQVNEYLS